MVFPKTNKTGRATIGQRGGVLALATDNGRITSGGMEKETRGSKGRSACRLRNAPNCAATSRMPVGKFTLGTATEQPRRNTGKKAPRFG
jgi:hypothetical protein